MTLNKIFTCGKIQLCTHNQSWDMDIVNSNSDSILCSIALLHVKIKIKKKNIKITVHDYLFVV